MTGRRGPSRASMDALANVDAEFVGERAAALGRAGRRVESAVAEWRALTARTDAPADDVEAALAEITAAAWALLVQRDCIGIRIDNLKWIRRQYDLPDAVVRRL